MDDLFGDFKTKNNMTVSYNTGTLFDLLTGSAPKTSDGSYVVNGGLTTGINGIGGKGGMYKSATMGSLMMRTLGIYPTANGAIIDTEDALTKDLDRLKRFSPHKEVDIDKRVLIINDPNFHIDEILNIIKTVCERKLKNQKDFTVETPFINLSTGKKHRAWVPTLVFIDSLSETVGVTEQELIESEGISGKKAKTWAMVDGANKTMFIRRVRKLCQECGICVLCSAHLGGVFNLDTYGPPKKQLQHMKQGEKVKNVGSKFEFLSSLFVQTVSAKILQGSSKDALYQKGKTSPQDINEIILSLIRCKTNITGTLLPVVVSQTDGLLNSVTNYHFLKSNGYFGLDGNKVNHKSMFLPDQNLSRNTFREVADSSYEMRRAIELTAQYLFIQMYWNHGSLPMDFSMDAEKLFDKLNKSSIKTSDLLNTRGYWTYKDQDDRKYMSIFDVVAALDK